MKESRVQYFQNQFTQNNVSSLQLYTNEKNLFSR